MRLLYKALFKNQKAVRNTMCLLIAVLLICIQMAVTTFSKNKTLLERVEGINGPHTQIFAVINEEKGYPENIEYYLQDSDYVEEYYSTYVAFYGTTCSFEGILPQECDQYIVLEGKRLEDLGPNEVAISSGYRDYLLNHGLSSVLGESLHYAYDESKVYTFVVVSVFDHPLYADYAHRSLATSRQQINNSHRFTALANYETVKEMVLERTGHLQGMDVDIYSRVAYKVKIRNYSAQRELEFEEKLFGKVTNADVAFVDFVSLDAQAQSDKVNNAILSVTWIIIISCLLVSTLLVFLNLNTKSILGNKASLTILDSLGMNVHLIHLAYVLNRTVVYLATTTCWLMANVLCKLFLYRAFFQDITLFYDISQVIIFRTLAISFLVYICIVVITLLQVGKVKNAPELAQVSRSQLQHGLLSFRLAVLELRRNYRSALRKILVTTIALTALLTIGGLNQAFRGIYHKDNSSIHFDYLAVLSYEEYEDIKNKFDMATLMWDHIREKVRFFDVRLTEGGGITQRVFYSSILMFYTDGDNIGSDLPHFFPNLVSGGYPTAEFNALVTTRIANELNAIPFDSEYFEEHKIPNQRGFVVFAAPASFGAFTSTPVNGILDSIDNYGYEIYLFNDFREPRISNSELGLGRKVSYAEFVQHYGLNYSAFIVLKDDTNRVEFEQYASGSGFTLLSYDDYWGNSIQWNSRQVRKVTNYLFIISTLALMFVLIIDQYSHVKVEQMSKKENNHNLRRIGIRSETIRYILWYKELLSLTLSALLALAAFLLIRIPCRICMSHALGLGRFLIGVKLPLLISASLVAITLLISVLLILREYWSDLQIYKTSPKIPG